MNGTTKTKIPDKRAAILETTLDLLSERGFHDTPMSMIARQSGVSTGIIYHYFDGKDELMDELYKEIKRNFGLALAENFDPKQPLGVQIRQMLGIMIRF